MNRRKILGTLLLLLLPIVAWVGVAGAQSFRGGDNVTVSKGETVDSTLFTSGRNLDIAGTVDGDIFCASQNVTISGTVNGDIICAAQTIRVSGTVNGDVRLAAQTVTLGSKISGSATIAAQSVSLDQDGNVGRDASIAAAEINLNGDVGRDAALTAGNITITSTIGRSVKASVEHLSLESGAKVGGDLTYTSGNQADIAKGADVSGVTHRYEPKEVEKKGAFSHIGILLNLYMVISFLIVALAVVLLFPRFFHDATDEAIREPLKTFLVGLVAALLFPVLFIALLVTVFGIPLALLLLLSWLLVIIFGLLLFNFYIGRLVLRGHSGTIVTMLLGTLIILIVSLIPFLGGLVVFVAMCMGIGMMLLRLRGYYSRPDYSYRTVPIEESAKEPTPKITRRER